MMVIMYLFYITPIRYRGLEFVMETTRRSIAKAISYRIFGTLTTAALVFVVLGQFELAAAVGLLDTLLKIFVYIAHERAWNRITYGREQKQPEYVI